MGCRYGNSIGYIDHQLDMGIRTIHQWESKHQYRNPYGLIPHSPKNDWLVVEPKPSEKYDNSSVGIMTFPI